MRTAHLPPILIATGNAGKVRELCGLFQYLPLQFKNLADFPDIVEVEETGSTFSENAVLKAVGYARQSGHWALADDSGLEIDALDGRPGVLSARYGGGNTEFAEKMRIVLAEMDRAGGDDRRARFACSMVLADGSGEVLASAEGICPGVIARQPRGTGGFGYDPIFIPDGFDQTFGELRDDLKAQISHRSQAAAKIMRYLLDFTGTLT